MRLFSPFSVSLGHLDCPRLCWFSYARTGNLLLVWRQRDSHWVSFCSTSSLWHSLESNSVTDWTDMSPLAGNITISWLTGYASADGDGEESKYPRSPWCRQQTPWWWSYVVYNICRSIFSLGLLSLAIPVWSIGTFEPQHTRSARSPPTRLMHNPSGLSGLSFYAAIVFVEATTV